MKDLIERDDDKSLHPITDAERNPGHRTMDTILIALPIRANCRIDAFEPILRNPSAETPQDRRHTRRIDNVEPRLLKSTTDNFTDVLWYPVLAMLNEQPQIIDVRNDKADPKLLVP
jgi:hypothetical protein